MREEFKIDGEKARWGYLSSLLSSCVYVYVCVHVCMHACVRVQVRVHVCVRVCVHACGLIFVDFMWVLQRIYDNHIFPIFHPKNMRAHPKNMHAHGCAPACKQKSLEKQNPLKQIPPITCFVLLYFLCFAFLCSALLCSA